MSQARDRLEAVAASMRAADAAEDDRVWKTLRWLVVAAVPLLGGLKLWIGY